MVYYSCWRSSQDDSIFGCPGRLGDGRTIGVDRIRGQTDSNAAEISMKRSTSSLFNVSGTTVFWRHFRHCRLLLCNNLNLKRQGAYRYHSFRSDLDALGVLVVVLEVLVLGSPRQVVVHHDLDRSCRTIKIGDTTGAGEPELCCFFHRKLVAFAKFRSVAVYQTL